MIEIRQYIAIALKWWWLLLLGPLASAAIGYALAERETPIYSASTTVLVGQTFQVANPTTGDFQISQQLAQTYADMARRQPVLQGVVETLKLDFSWRSLRNRVRITSVGETQLLEITAEAPSPEQARLIADEVAHQLILLSPTNLQNQQQSENHQLIRQQVEDLQTKINAGQEKLNELQTKLNSVLSAQQVQEIQGEIKALEGLIAGWEANYTQLLIFIESKKSPNYLAVIEPAQASSSPIRPRIIRDTFLAGIVGIVLVIGLIFVVEYLDDTLKSVDDLNKTLGLIALGTISRMKGKEYQEKLLTAHGPFSPEAEAYRMIRSNIQFLSVDEPLKLIMMTSAHPGEGKSVTAANLSIAMAQAGFKTILVDADLRRPIQHYIFQVPNVHGGLTELLRSPELELKGQLKNTKIENLQVLPSGVLPPNPAELLGSQRMRQVLLSLTQEADIVVFDSPPALAVTDSLILSNRVDGVILVVEAGHTRRDAVRQVLFNLQQAGGNLVGVVLNRVAKKKSGYYQGYYYAPHAPAVTDPSGSPKPKRRWQWLPFFK